jgi:3-hydroxyacyl-CoA dehydrogenase/enoyl-CoA hydratase/3-hydroxybutyryl-CoA epimerase
MTTGPTSSSGWSSRGRLGRKSKAGFYAYDDAGKRLGLWEGLSDLAPVAETQPDLTEVQHRLLFAQVLEAVRALEEGVLTDIREGDVGAILGWGFAPWSGGPFSWLDMLGAAYAAERCDALTGGLWPRPLLRPAPRRLLREMAEKGAVAERFYGRFGYRAATADDSGFRRRRPRNRHDCSNA